MTLGIATTLTDPGRRGDNYKDALECYEALADKVVIVDGHQTWPQEFEWPLIAQHFQWGYDKCDTDWVIRADLDYIFHERDFGKIRQALRDYPNAPAISFYKWQTIQPHKYNLKARLVICINKKKFGDRIKFDSGGDGCQPSLDGRELQLSEMPQAGVPFWNYEKLTKTVEQVADDVGRMDRAYHRTFGEYIYGTDGTDVSAFEGWIGMMKGRLTKPHAIIKLEEHPKFVQDTIRNLRPNQFGYSGFGHFPVCDYFTNNDRIEL